MGKEELGHNQGRLTLGFETFEHVADIGIRGFGQTVEDAFANAARAMFALMVEDLSSVRPDQSLDIHAESMDLEGLLVSWLNELLAQWGINGLVFSEFSPKITQKAGSEGKRWIVTATIRGEPFSPRRHGRGIEVKGATFSELHVGLKDGTWIAQCVVDV